ncbi:MAG: MBOAT family O-acyltransferase [Lacrimispora sphenoides]
MIFSSLEFIFQFLPIFLLLYSVCPDRAKNFCLLAGSLFFYFYGVAKHPAYMVLLLLSVCVNYWVGRKMKRYKSRLRRRKWFRLGIAYNLFWLLLFKYSGFLIEQISLLLQNGGLEKAAVPVLHLAFPLGISFYTFQAISYLADVYRKDVAPEKSFLDFARYMTMFPQLISGPIVTYTSLRELIKKRVHTMEQVEAGLREFTIGLGLKVLLSNQIGGLWSQIGAVGYESISTPLAWMGLAAFSLRLYFDFYGYSLMARGLGMMLGFPLPDNFNHPYMALTMTDFWRRWHMTLGGWFRNYVYIPLGGNREGFLKTFRNMLVVWLLTGLWHGTSPNFLLWGFVLFALISLEKLGLGKLLERWRVVGHVYMLFAIPLTWMLFAITDFSQLGIYIQRLFPFLSPIGKYTYFAGDFLKYGRSYGLSLCAGLIFMTGLPRRLYDRKRESLCSAIALLIIFWLCVYCMKMGANDPFMYFNF